MVSAQVAVVPVPEVTEVTVAEATVVVVVVVIASQHSGVKQTPTGQEVPIHAESNFI